MYKFKNTLLNELVQCMFFFDAILKDDLKQIKMFNLECVIKAN